MPSNTITLNTTIGWAKFFVGNRPLAPNSGTEPALTSANIIIQTMLQPPFRWKWNRKIVAFSITAANQDYATSVADFGYIEKASLTTGGGVITEIPTIAQELSLDSGTGRPHSIAPYLDDNNGSITFRFMPGKPDQTYTATVIYQIQPALLTALSNVWPIPDRYSFVYQQGFLGLMYMFADDQRAAFMLQRFVASLLALAEGLTEQERNTFLEQWQSTIDSSRKMTKSQQGIGARVV